MLDVLGNCNFFLFLKVSKEEKKATGKKDEEDKKGNKEKEKDDEGIKSASKAKTKQKSAKKSHSDDDRDKEDNTKEQPKEETEGLGSLYKLRIGLDPKEDDEDLIWGLKKVCDCDFVMCGNLLLECLGGVVV